MEYGNRESRFAAKAWKKPGCQAAQMALRTQVSCERNRCLNVFPADDARICSLFKLRDYRRDTALPRVNIMARDAGWHGCKSSRAGVSLAPKAGLPERPAGDTAGHHALDSAIQDVGRMGTHRLADRGVSCQHSHGPELGSLPIGVSARLVAPVAVARRADRLGPLFRARRVSNYSAMSRSLCTILTCVANLRFFSESS